MCTSYPHIGLYVTKPSGRAVYCFTETVTFKYEIIQSVSVLLTQWTSKRISVTIVVDCLRGQLINPADVNTTKSDINSHIDFIQI